VAAAVQKRHSGCRGTTALQILLLTDRQEDFLLTFNNISDSKRQQTITVDYKRLINGFFLTRFAPLRQKSQDSTK
jgi:hypothetical protein